MPKSGSIRTWTMGPSGATPPAGHDPDFPVIVALIERCFEEDVRRVSISDRNRDLARALATYGEKIVDPILDTLEARHANSSLECGDRSGLFWCPLNELIVEGIAPSRARLDLMQVDRLVKMLTWAEALDEDLTPRPDFVGDLCTLVKNYGNRSLIPALIRARDTFEQIKRPNEAQIVQYTIETLESVP